MVDKVHFSSDKSTWETPRALFDALNEEFDFHLDAAASASNAKCKLFFTEKNNALEQEWYRPDKGITRIFINPPYTRRGTGLWVQKCYDEWNKGATVVALLPARTDTTYFHKWIYEPSKRIIGPEIRFLKGRLKFEIDGKPICDKKGRPQSAPFPSMIVVWRGESKDIFG